MERRMVTNESKNSLVQLLHEHNIEVQHIQTGKDNKQHMVMETILISPLGYRLPFSIVNNGTAQSVWESLYGLATRFDVIRCSIFLFEEDNRYGIDACIQEAQKIQEMLWDVAQKLEDVFGSPTENACPSYLKRIIRKNEALGRNCCH